MAWLIDEPTTSSDAQSQKDPWDTHPEGNLNSLKDGIVSPMWHLLKGFWKQCTPLKLNSKVKGTSFLLPNGTTPALSQKPQALLGCPYFAPIILNTAAIFLGSIK